MNIYNLSRRERKKQETKTRILRAARHLFEEQGFENTPIEAITERADLSKGTFFNYFNSKDGLLAGIADQEVADILDYATHQLMEVNGAINKIKLIMNRLLEDAIPYPHLTGRVMFSFIINSAAPSPFTRINALLEELVVAGQQSGEITAAYTPTDVVTAILSCYYGVIFKWFEFGMKPGTTAELDRIFDIVFHGIRGPRFQGT